MTRVDFHTANLRARSPRLSRLEQHLRIHRELSSQVEGLVSTNVGGITIVTQTSDPKLFLPIDLIQSALDSVKGTPFVLVMRVQSNERRLKEISLALQVNDYTRNLDGTIQLNAKVPNDWERCVIRFIQAENRVISDPSGHHEEPAIDHYNLPECPPAELEINEVILGDLCHGGTHNVLSFGILLPKGGPHDGPRATLPFHVPNPQEELPELPLLVAA